jgi:hypothetical protein
MNKAHEVQLVNYLVAAGKSVGLILNFGERKVRLRVRLRPALAQCNKVRLCLAIPSKYHLLVTILL